MALQFFLCAALLSKHNAENQRPSFYLISTANNVTDTNTLSSVKINLGQLVSATLFTVLDTIAKLLQR